MQPPSRPWSSHLRAGSSSEALQRALLSLTTSKVWWRQVCHIEVRGGLAKGVGTRRLCKQTADDPSETKSGSPSTLKGARKRGWGSLAEADHGGHNQEDGGGRGLVLGSAQKSHIPEGALNSFHQPPCHKHTPAAGPLAGPQEKGGFCSEHRSSLACPSCSRRKLPPGEGEKQRKRRSKGGRKAQLHSATSSIRASERVPSRAVPPLWVWDSALLSFSPDSLPLSPAGPSGQALCPTPSQVPPVPSSPQSSHCHHIGPLPSSAFL